MVPISSPSIFEVHKQYPSAKPHADILGYQNKAKTTIFYWMRDQPVYGRNPANGKSGRGKATNLSS